MNSLLGSITMVVFLGTSLYLSVRMARLFREQKEIGQAPRGRELAISAISEMQWLFEQDESDLHMSKTRFEIASVRRDFHDEYSESALDPYLRLSIRLERRVFESLVSASAVKVGNPRVYRNDLWSLERLRSGYCRFLRDWQKALQRKDRGLLYGALSDLCYLTLAPNDREGSPSVVSSGDPNSNEAVLADLRQTADLLTDFGEPYKMYEILRSWKDERVAELPKETVLPLTYLQHRIIAITNPMGVGTSRDETQLACNHLASLMKEVARALELQNYPFILDLMVGDQD